MIGPLLGRSWTQTEVFGIAPDPTAIATLGIVLAARGRVRWELLIIPLIWCAISGATLWTMGSADAPGPFLMATLVLVMTAEARRSGFVYPPRRYHWQAVRSLVPTRGSCRAAESIARG